MALTKGYPDFFGYSIFPQYGTYVVEEKPATVLGAGATVTLFDITAKATVYGGFIHVYGFTVELGLTLEWYIDGDLWWAPDVPHLVRWGVKSGIDLPFVIMTSDVYHGDVMIGIKAGTTFVTSLKIDITSGGPVSAVEGILVYSQLT